MSTKKDKYQKAQRKVDKNQKKETEEIKITKTSENGKLKEFKEVNIKGIKNILKIQQESNVKVVSKKSSKKFLQVNEVETKGNDSDESPRQKINLQTSNKAIRKQSKRISLEEKPELKMQIEDDAKSRIQVKEQGHYQSWRSNNSGLKSQQSKTSQNKENELCLAELDFIQIDGIRMNQNSEMLFQVLMEDKKTKEQSHMNWNKAQLIPICRKKKRNLIYDYYIKLIANWAMHKER